MNDVPVFANVELQLAGWTVSHQHGAKLTFWIAEEDLAAFKTLTARHGKIAGQRLAAAFILIGDDEQPVRTEENTRQKGGPLSQLAGRLCTDEAFRAFVGAEDEEEAARIVRERCGVQSRAELDMNPTAGRLFHQLFRIPYVEASR